MLFLCFHTYFLNIISLIKLTMFNFGYILNIYGAFLLQQIPLQWKILLLQNFIVPFSNSTNPNPQMH